eukprot:scaffold78208_cov57-Phaeocystis_antarctica.AAC.2
MPARLRATNPTRNPDLTLTRAAARQAGGAGQEQAVLKLGAGRAVESKALQGAGLLLGDCAFRPPSSPMRAHMLGDRDAA